ncbi:MAG TPA: SgcJ/EcaC family oxidoreductase [Bryobacteraceae bacterium]|nr:SgcJ/EcaC family oxidoreductase [Bryobacteraceae bacterium]
MLRRLFLISFPFLLLAQHPNPNAEIRAMMKDSEDAWNRGDLVAFASYYEDSPETTFMGKEVVRGGTKAILERYRRSYPTAEAMGTLTFSEIEVRSLTPDVALVTGKFALKRTAAGGGDASGRYTLIVRRTPAGWKIIHDHTS